MFWQQLISIQILLKPGKRGTFFQNKESSYMLRSELDLAHRAAINKKEINVLKV